MRRLDKMPLAVGAYDQRPSIAPPCIVGRCCSQTGNPQTRSETRTCSGDDPEVLVAGVIAARACERVSLVLWRCFERHGGSHRGLHEGVGHGPRDGVNRLPARAVRRQDTSYVSGA
jgi:hypothetical protein